MKKWICVLLALAPSAVGYFYNLALGWTVKWEALAMLFLYVIPVLLLVCWFWAGRKYRQAGFPGFGAVALAHSVGFVSLGLYIWQFVLVADAQRNIAVAAFSQSFSASVGLAFPVSLFSRFVVWAYPAILEGETQKLATALQVINLVVMMIVFTVGYYWQRRKVVA